MAVEEITITAAELAAEHDESVQLMTRFLGVATALVDAYAPLAPTVVKNEAVSRVCAYFATRETSDWTLQSDGGGKQAAWGRHTVSALRHSGAMALLTIYRRRRAV